MSGDTQTQDKQRRAGPKRTALLLLASLFVPLGLSGMTLAANSSATSGATAAPSYVQQQRATYLSAKKSLRKRQMHRFNELSAKLVDYPLKPYLDYSELVRRLYTLPYQDVDHFLERHQHSYLGDSLLKQWLKTLSIKQRWHDFQSYYKPHVANTELRCYYAHARLQNGDVTALESVAELWNVGRSQPKACDPVFNRWLKSGHLTPALAWERFSKAIKNRKRQLARYVAKQMGPEHQKLATIYLEVDRHPERIKRRSRYRDQSPAMQEIILHGIRRLTYRDPLAALKAWEGYDAQQLFDDKARRQTQELLISRLAKKGQVDAAATLLGQVPNIESKSIGEWLVRDALRNRDWTKAYQWLNQLPQALQQSDRWLYWRARALDELKIDDPDFPTPRQLYAGLALRRSFYGFLAADILGHDYTLVDRPITPPSELMTAIANLEGMKRARELYALNFIHEARKEWFYTTRKLDAPAMVAAGKLAEDWGWYRKSIQAMIETRHWDDLQSRFPLAYRDYVDDAAEETAISPQLLYAIARQESAFSPDARSPAGAMGLMQLMPKTARATARKTGLKLSNNYDLLKPERNIAIGSRYLHQLLEQFNGNRILAAAAYNAGPHRVKQWLNPTTEKLPYDIWIETIPFDETRKYVQNVLSFSVIYAYRTGDKLPFITDNEAQNPL